MPFILGSAAGLLTSLPCHLQRARTHLSYVSGPPRPPAGGHGLTTRARPPPPRALLRAWQGCRDSASLSPPLSLVVWHRLAGLPSPTHRQMPAPGFSLCCTLPRLSPLVPGATDTRAAVTAPEPAARFFVPLALLSVFGPLCPHCVATAPFRPLALLVEFVPCSPASLPPRRPHLTFPAASTAGFLAGSSEFSLAARGAACVPSF